MGIAEAHGGSLTLVPTDVGACFRLSLPCATETDQTANLVSVSARR
jgi:signal transduction histidine kinase